MLVAVAVLASMIAGAEPEIDGTVVDMVVARVDDTVITLSELTGEARLVLLDARGPTLGRQARLTPPLLSAVLQSMVHRALLMAELRRLQLRAAPDNEIEVAVERLRRRFDEPRDFRVFLEQVGLADPDVPDEGKFGAPSALVARLRAELEVERFLSVRIRRNVVLSEGEVRACYEANRTRFAGLSFEDVAPRIRVRLSRQKEESALKRLLEQLSSRARIRVESPFDRPPQDEAADAELGFSCPERAP